MSESPNIEGQVAEQLQVSAAIEVLLLNARQFYFGDSNLPRDKFLAKEIAKDDDGWVELTTLAKFKKLQALTTDISVMASAIRNSESDLVEVRCSQHRND